MRTLLMCLLLAATASACATAPPRGTPEYDEYKLHGDPLQPMNEAIFSANMAVDKILVRPVTKTYLKITPAPARKGLTNFLANLKEPWTFVNALLQGKPAMAGETFGRFVINSTVGIGGLWDRAAGWGIERHDEDFGQTMAVWGVPPGPYLMLPFFGPSNFRDATGFTAEFFLDPVSIGLDHANVANIGNTDISALSVARISLEALDFRATNDSLFDELHEAADPYTLARSAYRQNRAFEISDGEAKSTEEEEDLFGDNFDEDFDEEEGDEQDEGDEDREDTPPLTRGEDGDGESDQAGAEID